jgi:tetratricopeptide (TPR) repeat protein
MACFQKAITCFRRAIELNREDDLSYNGLAWILVTCPEQQFRNPAEAVKLARKAVELMPRNGNYWNTLGVAHYRTGNWKGAVEALARSMQLRNGGDSGDWYFLAMAHWQLRSTTEARRWYDTAVEWMEKNEPTDDELCRFRAEAEELMKIDRKKD